MLAAAAWCDDQSTAPPPAPPPGPTPDPTPVPTPRSADSAEVENDDRPSSDFESPPLPYSFRLKSIKTS